MSEPSFSPNFLSTPNPYAAPIQIDPDAHVQSRTAGGILKSRVFESTSFLLKSLGLFQKAHFEETLRLVERFVNEEIGSQNVISIQTVGFGPSRPMIVWYRAPTVR